MVTALALECTPNEARAPQASRHEIDLAGATIGSAEGCTIRVEAPGVQRFHARIVLADGRAMVYRVRAEATVRVNGVEVEAALLRTGDTVQFGDAPPMRVAAPVALGPEDTPVTVLAHLCRATQAIDPRADQATVVRGLVEAAIALTGADRGFVAGMRAGRPALDDVAIVLRPGVRWRPLSFSRSVIDAALAADGPVLRGFDAHGTGRPTSVALSAIGTAMACPLRSPDGPIGVLYLDGQGERVEFSERDRGMLTLLSNMAALVVSQANRTQEAERLMQRVDHLAAAEGIAGGTAHDLKNVLTVMRSGTELLAEEPQSDPALGGILADMRTAVESADALAHRMMDIARLRNGRRELRPVSVLLAGAADLARRAIGERLHIAVFDEGHGATVHVEPYSVQRALLNLLLNAADASDRAGRVELRARLSAEGGHVVFQVVDHGHGVPADVRPRLFEPFFTTKAGRHGTGLGLATSLRIALDHAGTLVHRDTPGGGATFELTLPAG